MAGNVRVLAVDDDRGFGELTATFLERVDDDLSVEFVESPARALDSLDEEDFDCIVSDYKMPEMDGLAFLGAVREQGVDCPFVLFTGQGSEEIASEAISAGVTDYLRKESGTDQYAVLANRIGMAVESQRRAETLREREEWFRAILAGAKDVVTILDETGTIRYESPSVETELGWQPGDLEGDNAFEHVHPDDRERAFSEFARAVSDPGYAPTVELRFEDADGEWRHVEVTGRNRLDDPIVEGIVVNTRDITEHKRRHAQFDEQTERLRSIVENVPIVLFVLDPDGTFTLSVGRGLAAIGREPGEAVGSSVFDVYADHPEVADACRRALDGEAFHAEVGVDDRTFETWYQPVTDEAGDVERVIGVSVDVTGRKLREQQLERFAAIVSHDLRSPLTVAQGSLDLARETGESEHFERASRAHARMDEIIESVLAVARQGTAVEDPESVSLSAIAERAWSTIDTGAAVLELDDDGRLQAEADRLQQLFENLFRNAVEHGAQRTLERSAAGGAREEVTIRVGSLSDGFFVADDGPGIPPEDRESVFEYGYTTVDDGTGFGLGIVRSVAEAHGWSVSVTDAEHGGARFEITDE